jgi:transposase InsO family protein
MDVVGGFLLADGTTAKALTGIDDHSRFCVSARLTPRERTQLVCDGFTAAMRRHGVPQQVLTDNGARRRDHETALKDAPDPYCAMR